MATTRFGAKKNDKKTKHHALIGSFVKFEFFEFSREESIPRVWIWHERGVDLRNRVECCVGETRCYRQIDNDDQTTHTEY